MGQVRGVNVWVLDPSWRNGDAAVKEKWGIRDSHSPEFKSLTTDCLSEGLWHLVEFPALGGNLLSASSDACSPHKASSLVLEKEVGDDGPAAQVTLWGFPLTFFFFFFKWKGHQDHPGRTEVSSGEGWGEADVGVHRWEVSSEVTPLGFKSWGYHLLAVWFGEIT